MISFNNFVINNQNLAISFLKGSIINICAHQDVASQVLQEISGRRWFRNKNIVFTEGYQKSDIHFFNLSEKINPRRKIEDQLLKWAGKNDLEMLIPAAIHYFSLAEILEQKYQDLNIEQQKMVLFSKLMLDPVNIWVLDNPFDDLSDLNKKKIMQLILGKMHDGGVTFFSSGSEIDNPAIINLKI